MLCSNRAEHFQAFKVLELEIGWFSSTRLTGKPHTERCGLAALASSASSFSTHLCVMPVIDSSYF